MYTFFGELGLELRVYERLLRLPVLGACSVLSGCCIASRSETCRSRVRCARVRLPLLGACSALSGFLGLLVSPRPFRPSQKQLTQDDDTDEVEIAVDNTAFMDEFFSEVGAFRVFLLNGRKEP